MKKTLLAIAIPAALLATSAQAVELYKTDAASVDFYGQFRTQAIYSKGSDITLGAGSSRSGINASYAVNDNVSVFGTFEFGLSGNGGELENRLHFTGVEGDFGKFAFGKQWVVADDVWAADYSYFFGGTNILSESITGGSHNSLIKYNLDTENFWLAANVGLSEDDSEQDLYELFLGGAVGDVNLHAGYSYSEDNVEKSSTFGWENSSFEVTLEYTFGPGLIGFTYYNAQVENKSKDQEIAQDSFAAAINYGVNDSVAVYAGIELVNHDTTNIADAIEDSTVFYVGVDYQINDYSKLYVEYGYLDGSTLGFNSDEFGVVDFGSADKSSNLGLGYRVYW